MSCRTSCRAGSFGCSVRTLSCSGTTVRLVTIENIEAAGPCERTPQSEMTAMMTPKLIRRRSRSSMTRGNRSRNVQGSRERNGTAWRLVKALRGDGVAKEESQD